MNASSVVTFLTEMCTWGAGDEGGRSAPIAAQQPAAARPAKENEQREGGFHDLGHIARYTALACSAVQNVASKCGVQTAALPPQLEARFVGSPRDQFPCPSLHCHPHDSFLESWYCVHVISAPPRRLFDRPRGT